MADIVLGLTKSVVEGTVIKVQSAILEENQLKERVQHDLVFITDEFQMMQSFLNVVGRGQANNNVVRTWDCIEFVIHLDKKSAWWHRLFPSFMAPVLPSCLAPVLPLDEAVADIKQIKARVEDVSQRNMRYNLISDSGSKPVGPAAGGSSASDALVEVRDIAKELSGSGDLAELLTNNDGDLQVISIWETEGDHGESSIIRNVYDDPEIKRNFECLAWIKIMHPFDLSEFFQALRSQFYTNSGQQRQGAEVKLFTKFRTEVYKKRYLIVLEDLNTVSEWESIRSNLPNMRNGSRVVVSTQKVEIASLCTGHPFQVSQIRRFSYYHCVCMFFKELLFLITEAIFRSRGEFRFGVISVWGIAGVGKSTFVRTIYNSHDQFEMYGWVNVSHPFNLRDLACSLLLDLHQNGRCFLWLGEKDIDMFRTKDPIQECHKLLHKHKFLIVIDGLQSTEEWDLIKSTLLSGNSESFIIVITNEESVARHCAVEDNFVFNVNGLKADAALYLFIKENIDLTPEMIDEAKLIIKKCGGLPKVIVAIGRFMATRSKHAVLWRRFNKKFMHELQTNPGFESLRGLFAWMQSYFHNSPDSLKPCIFYLSIFPRDRSIRRRRLIRRIMQQTSRSGNRIVWCEVNSFFHEYIMSQQMDDNHIFSLQGRCSLTSQRTGRHLVIGSTWERDKIVFMSIDFSRLRSLTVFGKWESFFISDNMKLLRVLDLENASDVTNDDLERVVSLPRLKFLSLRGCKMVSRLPDSLGGLRQLQTLDIRHTSIVRLPTVIVKLHKLQYIRGGTKVTLGEEGTSASLAAAETETQPKCRSTHALLSWLPDLCRGRHAGDPCSGIEVPRGIEELTALHTLGVVNVGVAGGKAFLKELKNLTQLRKLGVSGINWKNIQELCSAVSCHRYLESLSVRLDKDEHGSSDDRLKEDLRNRIAEHPNKLVLKLKME
ncbi:hypothetical protein DAI22_11g194100 [Oryza sativa Japonica Group]|nr:hypothetical protein DAI22_11g194100 [Oryza sativa Japonica Group]